MWTHTFQLASKMRKRVHHVICSEGTLCVCVKKKIASHTHTYMHTHTQTTSTARFFPDCMTISLSCMHLHGMFFCIFFEVTLFLTFLFCCTLWTCSVLPTYDVYFCFHKIHFAVLVAAVSEFWLSNSSNWLSDAFYVEHFTKQMISGFRCSVFWGGFSLKWS